MKVIKMKPKLSKKLLLQEAAEFTELTGQTMIPSLFGVTDGKAVGTYLEHKFLNYLAERFDFIRGNSASGIDLPVLKIDIKTTSIKQPQSSCPFKAPRQKIYGLGYSLLVFVYDKIDDETSRTARLNIPYRLH